MAQTKQFESIIRRTNKDTFPVKDAEKRIVIDNDTQKAVVKTKFWGNYTYYIVSNSNGVRNVLFTSSVFPIMDGNDRKINISIDCQISCPPDNEVKLAESLHQIDKYPGNKLDEFIEQWVGEFVQDQQEDFINNFFRVRANLVSHINLEAKTQLGLDFQAIRCLLEGESRLETVHLTLEDLLLCFHDSPGEEHPFTANITLLIEPQNRINAIARRRDKSYFEQLFRKQLREYFFNHVQIENIYSNHEGVENNFKLHTEKLLQHYGRQIGAILLKDEYDQRPIISLEKKIIVELDVPDYPRPVKVENQIFITRVDAAKYDANKPENLDIWLEENVKRVVKQIYFGHRYNKIIELRDDLENKVKANLKNLVQGLGYNLDQIIIIPAFHELGILKKLEFDIDEKFVTRDQQEVKLKISVKAEGDERSSKIVPYLNNIQILPREMRKLVIEEIQLYLRTVTSGDFYEKFDDDNPQGTIKNNLSNLISRKLSKVFDAQKKYLSFDIGETDMIKHMDDLKREWHELEIEIISVADRGVNTFSASFRVQDNASGKFPTFQAQQFGVEEIKNRIIKSLTARLSSFDSHQLNYQNEESRVEIEKIISAIAIDAVKSSFGLNILVRDVYRSAAPMGDDDGYTLKKIGELKRSRIDAIADGDFEASREIDVQIRYLNESLISNRLALPDGEKTFLPDKTGDNNGNNNG